MHVASVDYAVTFAELVSTVEPVTFSAPGGTRYLFRFDTGQAEEPPGSGNWTVTWDSSWFNQAAAEAGIASTLDGTCANIATMLGLPLDQVQSAATVRRLWTLNQNAYSIIPGVTSGPQHVVIPDVMPYPARAAGADAAVAHEAGTVTHQ